jgi:hypothetical protein
LGSRPIARLGGADRDARQLERARRAVVEIGGVHDEHAALAALVGDACDPLRIDRGAQLALEARYLGEALVRGQEEQQPALADPVALRVRVEMQHLGVVLLAAEVGERRDQRARRDA